MEILAVFLQDNIIQEFFFILCPTILSFLVIFDQKFNIIHDELPGLRKQSSQEINIVICLK